MCRWKRTRPAARRLAPVVVGLMGLLLPSLGLLAPAIAQDASPNADQALEELLQRLQLEDLHTLHLEQQVARSSGPQRISIARRLADGYASQLLAAEGAPADALREKIKQLVATVPEADTAALGIVLLQASFQKAESDAIRWLNEADSQARSKAQVALLGLAPDLTKRQKTLRQKVQDLEDRLGKAPSEEAEQTLTQQLERETLLMLRATFLAGWANYYDGVLNQKRPSQLEARTMFQQLLGLDDSTDGELTAEWLGLEAPARARSLIGLAMADTALGNTSRADTLFALLADPIVAPEIRDQAGQWKVRSLLNVGQLPAAREAATQLVEDFDSRSSPGKAQLCTTLVQTGFTKQPDGSYRDAPLGRLGLRGLAKMGEFRLLRQLLEKQGITLDQINGMSGNSFYLRWLIAQEAMQSANESKQASDYEQAVEKFKLALSADLKTADAKQLAQCRNEYAWCLYHAEQWKASGDAYRQASEDLRTLGESEAAEKGMWMAFVAYQHGASENASLEGAAKQTLETLVRQHPDSEYARKAKYQLAKMTGSADTQLAELESVQRDDAQYLDALFDICAIRHQQWMGARGTAAEATEAKAAVEAVEKYLKEAREASKQQQLKTALLGVEVAADGRPGQPAALGRLLKSCEGLVEGQDSALQATYHYQSLRRSLSVADEAQAQQHAEWLESNPGGEPYLQTALVILAKAADAAVAAADDGRKAAVLQRAEEVYSRLSRQLGDTPEVLAANRNAQVALYKSAEYQLQQKEFESAAKDFDKLLKVAPKSRVFIRGAARALFGSGDFKQALPHWRALLRASKDGDDAWYEAKYHQIACLLRTDPASAANVRQQFDVLHPDPPEEWKKKLAALR